MESNNLRTSCTIESDNGNDKRHIVFEERTSSMLMRALSGVSHAAGGSSSSKTTPSYAPPEKERFASGSYYYGKCLPLYQ